MAWDAFRFILEKVQEVNNYDDFVILGTLYIILKTNNEYDNFFKTIVSPNEYEDVFKNPDINIFTDFVCKLLLKDDEEVKLKDKCSAITTDLKFDFTDFSVAFDNKANTGTFDKDATKKNFVKNFVSLAQVFYEIQFSNDMFKSTHDFSALSLDVNRLQNKEEKTFQVVYYTDARTNNHKIQSDDFNELIGVNFETVSDHKILRKKVIIPPIGSEVTHQVIILDHSKMTDAQITEIIKLCTIDTVIILVGKTATSTKSYVNIKTLNKLSAGNTANQHSFIMCHGSKSTTYSFDANIKDDNFECDNFVSILPFIVFSNIVVYIKSD
jgi:hypothetical protein